MTWPGFSWLRSTTHWVLNQRQNGIPNERANVADFLTDGFVGCFCCCCCSCPASVHPYVRTVLSWASGYSCGWVTANDSRVFVLIASSASTSSSAAAFLLLHRLRSVPYRHAVQNQRRKQFNLKDCTWQETKTEAQLCIALRSCLGQVARSSLPRQKMPSTLSFLCGTTRAEEVGVWMDADGCGD